MISSPSTGYSSLYTRTGIPSLPGALSRLALNIAFLTSSLLIGIHGSCLYVTGSSSCGGVGKNVLNSSSSISWFSIVISSVPCFLIGGTLANKLLALVSRYFAAFYTLSLSSRKTSQCCFLCRRIVRWNSRFALAGLKQGTRKLNLNLSRCSSEGAEYKMPVSRNLWIHS